MSDLLIVLLDTEIAWEDTVYILNAGLLSELLLVINRLQEFHLIHLRRSEVHHFWLVEQILSRRAQHGCGEVFHSQTVVKRDASMDLVVFFRGVDVGELVKVQLLIQAWMSLMAINLVARIDKFIFLSVPRLIVSAFHLLGLSDGWRQWSAYSRRQEVVWQIVRQLSPWVGYGPKRNSVHACCVEL